MITLDQYSAGRSNNFNLLRFILASLVIFTHAMGLTGDGDKEPLGSLIGHSFGSLAVDMFFVVSGFLIAKSWLSKKDIWLFVFARTLRIYPGLLVCVGLCVFVLGPVFTVLPLAEYFSSIDTLKFALENSTLIIKGVFLHLPGVFEGQGSGAVNTSLWTLPFEVKMYGLLLLLGVVGLLRRLPVLLLTLVAGTSYVYFLLTGDNWLLSANMSRFVFLFFAGSGLYIYRDIIPLNWVLFLALVTVVGVAIVYASDKVAMSLLVLATPYLTLFLALVPSGYFQLFNRCGDYSYGLYIYAFPVQQSVLALAAGFGIEQGWIENCLYSWLITMVFAVLSWHLIESVALKRHVTIAEYFRQRLLHFLGRLSGSTG